MLVTKKREWMRKVPEEHSLHITRNHGIEIIGENIHFIIFDVLNLDAYEQYQVYVPREQHKELFKEFVKWYNTLNENIPFNFYIEYYSKKTEIVSDRTLWTVPKGSLAISGDAKTMVLIRDLVVSFWEWNTEKNRYGYSKTEKFWKEKIR